MFRLCSTEDSIEPENSLSLCKEMLFLGFVILRVLNSGVLAAGSYSSRFLAFLDSWLLALDYEFLLLIGLIY